eukprot:jgi/Tetstr1/454061/TSEL_040980.t1
MAFSSHRWLAAVAVAVLVFVDAGALVAASSSDKDDDDGGEKRDASSDGADDNEGKRRVNCKGRGDQYCYKSWEEKDCPGACRRHCDPKGRMGSKMWSAIKSRNYDQVFTRSDKVCVARCKNGKKGCGKRVSYQGSKYCLAIRCDVGQVEGCHSGDDFDTPSCEACEIMFPRACKNLGGGKDSSDDDSDDDSDDRKRSSDEEDDDDSDDRKRSSDEDDSSEKRKRSSDEDEDDSSEKRKRSSDEDEDDSSEKRKRSSDEDEDDSSEKRKRSSDESSS